MPFGASWAVNGLRILGDVSAVAPWIYEVGIGVMKKKHRRIERPYGEQFDYLLTAKVPMELDRAVRMGSELLGVSMSAVIRKGIEMGLAQLAIRSVEGIRDTKMRASRKMALMKFLRATREAALKLHDPEVAKLLANVREDRKRERRRERRAQRSAACA